MQASIIPTFRCQEAPRMIAWLCDAFGFTRHAVYPDEQGGIAHAELVLGDAKIMLGSDRADEFGALGAETLIGPRDAPHGGRAWSCRDPEGNLWNFGTYDPWAKP